MLRKIYWEKQGLDRLCGVHSINSALQGPYFSEVSLAQLALALDEKEQQLMGSQGMTKEYLKYMQEESGNVANDGYYSLQVLQEALKGINLTMSCIDFVEPSLLTSKSTFICNSSDHWFSIKKVDEIWYNLNSTNKRMPQIISDFYLAAFLISVKQFGYQIFSIEGTFPKGDEDTFQHYNKNQMWIDARRILKYHEKRQKRKNYQPNISGASNDTQMEKAIAASLGKKYEKYVSSGEDSDWAGQHPKKKEKKYLQGAGTALSEQVFVNYGNFSISDTDPQLFFSLRHSIEQGLKAEVHDGREVCFRMPNGSKIFHVFRSEAMIEDAYNFIWAKEGKKFYLVNFQNKQVLQEVEIPLFALEDQQGKICLIVNGL